MGKFKYRLLKSSWGIAIDIVGDCEILDSELENKTSIHPKIYLEFKKLNLKLNLTEEKVIKKGIILSLRENERHFPNKYFLVTISEISFNECDYQEEGLKYAAWSWLNNELGFDLPRIDAKFDKKLNKYVFNSESYENQLV